MGIIEIYKTADNLKNNKPVKVLSIKKPVTQMNIFQTQEALSVVYGTSNKQEASFILFDQKGKKYDFDNI